MDAWKPVIEGEKAARRVAGMLGIFTAGRDSEIESLRTPLATKLRSSYARLWTGWKALDRKRDDRWRLCDLIIEIDGKAYRRAREFDIERWISVDVPEIRSQAVVGVRRTLRTLGTPSSRLERREVNEIIAHIGKELEYLDWAL